MAMMAEPKPRSGLKRKAVFPWCGHLVPVVAGQPVLSLGGSAGSGTLQLTLLPPVVWTGQQEAAHHRCLTHLCPRPRGWEMPAVGQSPQSFSVLQSLGVKGRALESDCLGGNPGTAQ